MRAYCAHSGKKRSCQVSSGHHSAKRNAIFNLHGHSADSAKRETVARTSNEILSIMCEWMRVYDV